TDAGAFARGEAFHVEFVDDQIVACTGRSRVVPILWGRQGFRENAEWRAPIVRSRADGRQAAVVRREENSGRERIEQDLPRVEAIAPGVIVAALNPPRVVGRARGLTGRNPAVPDPPRLVGANIQPV